MGSWSFVKSLDTEASDGLGVGMPTTSNGALKDCPPLAHIILECNLQQDRDPLLPKEAVREWTLPVVGSVQLNGEALSSGQIRDNQATLRKTKREASQAAKSKACTKAKTKEPSGQAPLVSADPSAAGAPMAKSKAPPSEKRLQEERKARVGMDRLVACWENMPDCRPAKREFDPGSFKNLTLV